MLGKQGSLKSAYAVFRLPELSGCPSFQAVRAFRLPELSGCPSFQAARAFRLPENRLAVAIRCVYNARPLQGSLKIRFVTKERP